MSSTLLLIVLALVAGVGIALQAGVNSQLGRSLGNPILAAFISFSVGTLALAVVFLVSRSGTPEVATFRTIPVWAWTGGLLGAFFVAASIFLAPRLGAASLLTFMVAAQLITALVLDHFGWLGFPERLATLPRVLGAVLLAAGAALIRFA